MEAPFLLLAPPALPEPPFKYGEDDFDFAAAAREPAAQPMRTDSGELFLEEETPVAC